MMKSFELRSITEADLPIPGADPWYARREDPALTVMTDFRELASITVAESAPIDAALEHMKHAGVRCAFATNESERVVGLITSYDIVGEKPLRHARTVTAQRKDILVRDIMVRIADWKVAYITDLERSTVEDVRRRFDESALTHLPVVEPQQSGQLRLRGLLSAAKVRRLLSKAK